MRRFLTVVGMWWLLGGAVAHAADADSLIADQIKYLNALADGFEKKDDTGIRTATALLLHNRAKLAELKLSDEDKHKLTAKHGNALDKANERVANALTHLDLGLSTMLGGGAGNAEVLIKQLIQSMSDLADAIEKKDEAKGKELAKKLDDLNKKMNALKLPDADQKKLEEKYKDELMKAFARFIGAASKDPEFMKKIEFKPGGR